MTRNNTNEVDIAYFATLNFYDLNDNKNREQFIYNIVNNIIRKNGGKLISIVPNFSPHKISVSALLYDNGFEPQKLMSSTLFREMWDLEDSRIGMKIACQQAIFMGETSMLLKGISLFEGKHVERFRQYSSTSTDTYCPLIISTGVPYMDFIFRLLAMIITDKLPSLSWDKDPKFSSTDIEVLLKLVALSEDFWCELVKTDKNTTKINIKSLELGIKLLFKELGNETKTTNLEKWLDIINWELPLAKEQIYLADHKARVKSQYYPTTKGVAVPELEIYLDNNKQMLKDVNRMAGGLNIATVPTLPIVFGTLHQMQWVHMFPIWAVSFAILLTFLALIVSFCIYALTLLVPKNSETLANLRSVSRIIISHLPSSSTKKYEEDKIRDYEKEKIRKLGLGHIETQMLYYEKCDEFIDEVIEREYPIGSVRKGPQDLANAQHVVYLAKIIKDRSFGIKLSGVIYAFALILYAIAAFCYFIAWYASRT